MNRFFLFILFCCLLPGCSSRRQQNRDAVLKINTLRTDSLLLRELNQSVRNKVVRIEHLLFESPDSGLMQQPVRQPLHSITRIAIDERTEQETNTSVEAGSVSYSSLQNTDSEQISNTTRSFPGKLLFGLIVVLFLIVFIRRSSI